MADKTGIEWTDATWNPVRGCSRISTGCGGANHQGGCYAEKIAARFSGPGQPFEGFAERTPHGGRWTGKMALVESALDQPLRWKRPRRIFVNSMSDLFHENLPDEAIDNVFAVMALAPQHTFQVLTKRADRMRQYMETFDLRRADSLGRLVIEMDYTGPLECLRWPLPNVWLGVSVEDQATADSRIPDLLATPASKRFLSCEPLLGPVDVTPWLLALDRAVAGLADDPLAAFLLQDGIWRGNASGPTSLHWVIAGGESGPNARPMHPDWARQLRDQCAAAGVPFFFKQWGEWAPGENATHAPTRSEMTATLFDGRWQLGMLTPRQSEEMHRDDEPDLFRFGKKASGAFLDGREHKEFPA